MDFDQIKEKKKEIGMVAVLLVVVVVLLWVGSSVAVGGPLSISFTKSIVKAGGDTILIVQVHNNGEEDAKSVAIEIVPESSTISVTPEERVEPVIGKGAFRKIDFEVVAAEHATPGTYKIDVTVDMLGEEVTGTTYLTIEK